MDGGTMRPSSDMAATCRQVAFVDEPKAGGVLN